MQRILLALLILICAPAAAQDVSTYPSRAIRIIVPFPPGGIADLLPRLLAKHLSDSWRQPVVVFNSPGAGGNIGATAAYRAEPDGYTLLSTPLTPLVINPGLHKKLEYDALKFVPVSVVGAVPMVMLVNPKLQAKSVQAFISYAKANPGKLNFGSQGNGTTAHLTAELFKSMAGGLDITHVPYKGSAPSLMALASGDVQLMFDNLSVALEGVRSGQFAALAVCGGKRVASLPAVPAMSEILPGFQSIAAQGLLAPPGTPLPIAEKLSAAIAAALKSPDIQKRLADLSVEPLAYGPSEMAGFLKEDTARWRAVIQSANVRID